MRSGRSIRTDSTAKSASPIAKSPTESAVTRIVFMRTAAATGSANLFSIRIATTLPSSFSGVLIWRNCEYSVPSARPPKSWLCIISPARQVSSVAFSVAGNSAWMWARSPGSNSPWSIAT